MDSSKNSIIFCMFSLLASSGTLICCALPKITGGFQWVVNPRWVLEGGVIQDFNGPNDANYIISTRFHF